MASGAPTGTNGTVLVMDDELFVREVLGAMLRESGWSPVFAVDCDDAAIIYRQAMESGNRPVAALLDLTIPGNKGGKAAIPLLKALDPLLKAVASSGYSDDPIMVQPAEFGFAAAIHKPYTIEEIDSLLRALVQNPDASA